MWQPTVPCRVDTEFVITFEDPLSSNVSFIRIAPITSFFIFPLLHNFSLLILQISIQAIANAIDVPVWVERQNIDLKICMYDRLYQDTIVVSNR